MGYRLTKNAGEALRSVGALSTVGIAFVLAIVIGAWIGSLLDGWLGTKPAFFFVFFVLGLAAGILNVFRTVARVTPSRTTPGAARPEEPGPSDEELRDSDR
jgi:ATP synthase protein I